MTVAELIKDLNNGINAGHFTLTDTVYVGELDDSGESEICDIRTPRICISRSGVLIPYSDWG